MKGEIGKSLGTIIEPGTFMNRRNRRRALKLGLVRLAFDPRWTNVGVMAMLTLQEGGLIQPGQKRLTPEKKRDFRKNLVIAPTKEEREAPPEEAPQDTAPPVTQVVTQENGSTITIEHGASTTP